ncbi:hypothetical protein MMC31_005850 [Peltigera leucophlebia]|nr:hypothetical protein [Peltigera leucophlebia]
MDSDPEGSSAAPESSKGKARPQSPEIPEEDTHYTVILDDEGEGGSDPNARITLLNQRTRKPLSVITTKEEFLSNVEKFTSPWLNAIFGLTNSFSLRDENVVLSDDLERKSIVDSDDEDSSQSQPHTSWQSTPATTNRFIPPSKSRTPASTIGTTVQVGNNKKYPDVPHFYGNGDDREKDHCKDTAFEVIKAKANPSSANAYLTPSEMIQDLENMFGEFDKFAKSDALLHDPKFGMAGTNPKEIFNEFLARFTSAIAPLDFTNRHKISNLRRTLSERLRFKIADGTTYTSFSQYVSRCRQCDLDLRQADGFSNRNRNNKSEKTGSSSSSISSRRPGGTTVQSTNLNRYRSSNGTGSLQRSRQLKERLIKKDDTLNVGRKVIFPQTRMLYAKGQAAISDQKLILDLQAVEVKTNPQQHASDSEN